MADEIDGNERRRHPRRSPPLTVELDLEGSRAVRLVDASSGGLFVEVGGIPPALGARGRARIRRGDVVVERRVRVVRIRWSGRDRGTRIGAGLALAFADEDADEDADDDAGEQAGDDAHRATGRDADRDVAAALFEALLRF